MNLRAIDVIATRLWFDKKVPCKYPANVLAGFERCGRALLCQHPARKTFLCRQCERRVAARCLSPLLLLGAAPVARDEPPPLVADKHSCSRIGLVALPGSSGRAAQSITVPSLPFAVSKLPSNPVNGISQSYRIGHPPTFPGPLGPPSLT
jgi:hypothetical protein